MLYKRKKTVDTGVLFLSNILVYHTDERDQIVLTAVNKQFNNHTILTGSTADKIYLNGPICNNDFDFLLTREYFLQYFGLNSYEKEVHIGDFHFKIDTNNSFDECILYQGYFVKKDFAKVDLFLTDREYDLPIKIDRIKTTRYEDAIKHAQLYKLSFNRELTYKVIHPVHRMKTLRNILQTNMIHSVDQWRVDWLKYKQRMSSAKLDQYYIKYKEYSIDDPKW